MTPSWRHPAAGRQSAVDSVMRLAECRAPSRCRRRAMAAAPASSSRSGSPMPIRTMFVRPFRPVPGDPGASACSRFMRPDCVSIHLSRCGKFRSPSCSRDLSGQAERQSGGIGISPFDDQPSSMRRKFSWPVAWGRSRSRKIDDGGDGGEAVPLGLGQIGHACDIANGVPVKSHRRAAGAELRPSRSITNCSRAVRRASVVCAVSVMRRGSGPFRAMREPA